MIFLNLFQFSKFINISFLGIYDTELIGFANLYQISAVGPVRDKINSNKTENENNLARVH